MNICMHIVVVVVAVVVKQMVTTNEIVFQKALSPKHIKWRVVTKLGIEVASYHKTVQWMIGDDLLEHGYGFHSF